MKKIFGLIFNRWTMSLLGVLIIALLVWIFGDQIAIGGSVPLASALSRLIVIGVIVFIWLAIMLVSALRRKKTNAAVVEGLLQEPAAAPEDPSAVLSREERGKLEERFRDAVSTLQQLRLGGHWDRKYLYQLPWYVIIGAPGCGKTTALANSGLKFPLSDKMNEIAVRGVGGTRNCDWFFAEDVVFIDTAGRYTTQDSDEAVDRSAWQSFLDLLRKHRGRRPIDGILVAFSIVELAQADSPQRLMHARAIKRRVAEIYDVLKVRAPVYVLFTKCDLIAGFSDFFHELSADERHQVWGTTFTLEESRNLPALLQALPGEYQKLVERLSVRIISRLDQERDVARRTILLSFPQQMNLLVPAMAEFMNEAFGQSRFEEPLYLRGFYLTSATQEGTPIDRVIGSVARAFRMQPSAMPAYSGRGSSFFLTRLIRDVILPESGLVMSTSFFGRNHSKVLWAAYGGLAALTLLLLAGMGFSYLGNRTLVADTGQTVDAIASTHKAALAGRGDVASTLAALSAIRNLPGGYAERDESAPLRLGFGLYQGDKLGEAARDSYRRALNQLFVPILMQRLEQQVAENADNIEFVYQALKAYLMFTTPDRRDSDFVKLWIGTDWNNRYAGAESAAFRDSFNGHLDALLEKPLNPTPEGNKNFIERTRVALLSLPPGSRIYAELQSKAVTPQSPRWTLADNVAASDLAYFRRKSGKPFSDGIPDFYTIAGYQKNFVDNRATLVDAAGRDTWVLGPGYDRFQTGNSDVEAVRKAEELYINQYIQYWDTLVNDLELVTPTNVEQLVDMLRAVSLPTSPVKAVFGPIVKQTQLSATLRAQEAARQQQPLGRLDSVTKNIKELLGSAAQAGAPAADPTQRVDDHFRDLARLIGADNPNGEAPIDSALRPLGDLSNYILQSRQAGADPKQALQTFRDNFPKATALATQLQATARAQPEPIRRMLTAVSAAVTNSAVAPQQAEASQRVRAVWQTSVAKACQEALDNRYPFVPSSNNDTNLVDFARVLGPNGLIDKFAKEYIEPFADTSVQPWRWLDPKSGGLRMSSNSLAMFERAARIRQAFFSSGMPQPSVFFDVEPVDLDNKARSVQLQVGDQSVSYQHGPRRPSRLQWPPTSGTTASVLFTPFDNPNSNVALTKLGPWAFFRLVDAGQLTKTVGVDRFQLAFNIDSYSAAFEIRAESVINPLYLPELRGFRCLDAL